MKKKFCAIVWICFVAAACEARKTKKRPMWAPQYKVSWNFSVPYVSEYQKTPLIYQYVAFQDYENSMQRVVRDDVETVIIRVEDDLMYEIFPAQDQFMCWEDSVHGGTGPTRRRRRLSFSGSADDDPSLVSSSQPSLTSSYTSSDDPPQSFLGFVLPDLSEDRWQYKGSERYSRTGDDVDVWEWDLTEGEMEMRYTFYTDFDGLPVELNMLGVNLYTGGHKDNYVAYYYGYEEVSAFPDGTFEAPDDVECVPAIPDLAAASSSSSSSSTSSQNGARRSPNQSVFQKFAPSKHWGDEGYDKFVHRHGRRHASKAEYTTRSSHFHSSVDFIQNWNKKTTHRVALNHFADWSRQEYLAMLGLKKPISDATVGAVPHDVATVANFTDTPHFLPAEMSWRGTPADSPVKDQSACGSCYAFSAVASLESALYRTTGEQTLLAEQEMLDCGWEAPGSNTGCFGGDQDRALTWALNRGGMASLDDYPYRGINDFCRRDVQKVPIKGKIVFVKGGETALQAALLSQGPMAVSVDAESDSFRFYAGGVYDNPECATASEDLSHAVIASGYGVDSETNTPYWLVKNMWSPYWGENGYIRIARGPSDCGIATQPMYIDTT